MKEFYTAPEAEIVRFAAEEALASNELKPVSFVGIDVTEKQDGDWSNWNSWFN